MTDDLKLWQEFFLAVFAISLSFGLTFKFSVTNLGQYNDRNRTLVL